MRKTLWLAALAGTLLTLSGCQEDEPFSSERSSGKGQISFLVDSDPQEQVLTKGEDNTDSEAHDMVLTSQDGDKLMFSMEISDIPSRLSQEQTLVTRGVPATNESLSGVYSGLDVNGNNAIGILSFWSESSDVPYIQNDWLKYDDNATDTDKKWVAYKNTYYWPKIGTLDFWAWAPNKIDPNTYNVTRMFNNTSVVKDGKIAFTYDLGSGTNHGSNDAKMQPDLIFSNVKKASANNVNYPLDHALAAVRFKVTASDMVTVKKISLVDVSKSGSCFYDPASTSSKFTWTLDDYENVNNKGTYTQTFSKGIPGDEETSTDVSVDADGTIFMMLPQPISGADRKIEITIENSSSEEVTYSGFIPALEEGWKAGKMYTYTLKINGELDIEVIEGFNNTTKSDVKVQNTGGKKVYVRMAVVANWVDSDGRVVMTCDWTSNGTLTGSNWGDGKNWFKENGWFYYKKILSPGKNKFTDALFTSYTPSAAPYSGLHLDMRVMAQAVECDTQKIKVSAAWSADIASKLEPNN